MTALWRGFCLGCVGVVTFLAATALLDRVFAQERDPAYHQTRSWTIGNSNVYVIDTAGVCLYVYSGMGPRSGIAAVPKTQLPAGTGCQ